MTNGGENALYFVSTDGALENVVDTADFISGSPTAAFAYIVDNQLEATHKVFQVSTTTNLLSIWTGE